MGTISSNIGLISGFPILDTVDKLVAISAAPRESLTAATKKLTDKQTAVTSITALVTALQITSSKLKGNLLYSEQTVTSGNPSLLSVATVSGKSVTPGAYQFTPIRQTQTQRFTSARIASETAPLGAGTFAVRFGGYIDRGASIDLLNGGEGFDRGKIKIVDRSGASAVVDLSLARNVDDILTAINSATGIQVTARADGDHLRLVDTTGQTAANLRVLEVDDGTTAASLGLAGINVAATAANGSDLLHAFGELALSQLNQGTGVRFDEALDDLQIQFRDGTSATVDFHRLKVAGTKPAGTTEGANGPEAKVKFMAVAAGAAYADVQVIFQDDNAIVAGSNETVAYDDQAKTLTFRIAEGATTADHVIAALQRNPVVSQLFTAARGTTVDGSGFVSSTDTATLTGQPASAVTPATNGNDAKLIFTAVTGGAALDDVTIEFVDNLGIQGGQETVVYDDSNPLDKRLIFQVRDGETTADHIIAALANDSLASQKFTAARAVGASGQGLISAADTAVTSGGAIIEPIAATDESTLAEVLATLNSVAPGKLQAAIGPDGKRLVLTDVSTDNGGTFSITELNGSKAATDLGLTADANGDTLTGGRLLAGLKTSLVRDLGGGLDASPLGSLSLTDRSGATANVDLSSAETVDDILDGINAAGLGIVATINQARDGIQLSDTTGSTASNLIVANADATNTADRLQLAASAASNSVSSGDLKLRVVSESTTLASLNGGRGVTLGTFTIHDTLGASATAHITAAQSTIGDVVDMLNGLGLAIHARINDRGDGIAIEDTAHGGNTLSIAEGNSTTAADLHLLSAATTEDVNSQPTQVIDGSTRLAITLSATDSLTDLVKKINDAKAGVTASIFDDGSIVKPFRLVLTSQVAGTAGALRVDASQLPFALTESVQAQDALLQVDSDGTNGLLASSSNNVFENVLPGARLTVNGSSQSPVTITSTSSTTTLSASLTTIVDMYNKIHTKLKDLTKFDENSGTSAILQGDSAALRVEQDLAELFARRTFGAGSIQTLQELGISLTNDGALTFDQATFNTKFANDPTAVQKFFTTEKFGFAARIQTITDQLAGAEDSLLTHRSNALAQTIENNQARIARMTLHLEVVRLQLLKSFYQSEQLIAKIKNNLNALASISVISAPGSTSSISI